MVDEKQFQRTTFDARIQYYNLLSEVLQAGKQFGVLSDLRGWYRCLHITYNMVCPYIEPSHDVELRKKLFTAREKILALDAPLKISQQVRFQRQLQADKLLLELDEELHRSAKRMMLPLENNFDGEFDIDRFMRESDLSL